MGVPGSPIGKGDVALGEVDPFAIADSRAFLIPFGEGTILPSSLGVAGFER